MAFVDEIHMYIKAGTGGDGVVRWHQEKFKPKGGPSGGNGGRGGDIYVEAVSDLAYLATYKFEKKVIAPSGDAGGNNSCEGKKGDDIILKFPVGSYITFQEKDEVISLEHVGQKVLLAKGGRGGLGNEHFKASTNTTPYESTTGEPGQEFTIFVELRLIADAGLVGMPSVGKSSILNALTHAQSKVADYHFTTLDPHLGKFHQYILADIPGLIEGASQGRGLGYKFLKHIKRTRLLVHVISCEDPVSALDRYHMIRNELASYDTELIKKPEIIVLNKTDMITDDALNALKKDFMKLEKPVYTLCLFDDQSIKNFQDSLVEILK